MKKFISILTVLLFVFGFSANLVMAADISGTVAYTPTGATVGTSIAASATLTTFTTTKAVSGGNWITLTFPAGTTLTTDNIVAGDFTIQETGAASAATAPVSVVANNTAKTITFILHPSSLSTDTPGIGVFTIALSGTAGGNEITHPTTSTAAGTFSVATETGDTGSISTVSIVAGNLDHFDVALTVAGTKTANSDFTVTITAHDQYSNQTTKQTDGTPLGAETFTFTTNATAKGAGIPLYATVDFTGAGQTDSLDITSGQVVSDNIRLFNAGETPTITVSAEATTAKTGTSAAITVGPATKAKLAFNTQPSTMSYRGQLFITQPKVEIQDTYGNRTADVDNVTLVEDITATTCDGGVHAGTLGTTLTKAAVAGLATFTDITFDTTTGGTNIYLKATSGTLTEACSNGFYISSSTSTAPAASTYTATTTTTTAPATETTTTTSTAPAVTSMPQPVKPITEMNQTEKNDYTMSLQQFLINLLVQLLNLIKAQKGL